MKVLVAHADLQAGGGAEDYARAIIDRIRASGDRVDCLDIHGLVTPAGNRRPASLALGRMPALRSLHLWKYALVCRVLPRLAKGYDRVILTYGEGPRLNVPTLTLRHAPALFSTSRLHQDALGAAGRSRGHKALRVAYTHTMRRIARADPTVADGPIITNSRWTANAVRTADATLRVLYPKVTEPARRAVARKSYNVIAIGRLTPNKRVDDAISIVRTVRSMGLPAELDIVGRGGTAYARRLIRKHRHESWLRFHPDADRPGVCQLLGRAAYGLHCYRHEHFGVAVAEMICSGVVPLVYDGGGVRELVERRALRFRSTAEAAERLADLMTSAPQRRDALSSALRQGAALGRALRFDALLGPLIAEFMGDPL